MSYVLISFRHCKTFASPDQFVKWAFISSWDGAKNEEEEEEEGAEKKKPTQVCRKDAV